MSLLKYSPLKQAIFFLVYTFLALTLLPYYLIVYKNYLNKFFLVAWECKNEELFIDCEF